jgi:hypothetical protein
MQNNYISDNRCDLFSSKKMEFRQKFFIIYYSKKKIGIKITLK